MQVPSIGYKWPMCAREIILTNTPPETRVLKVWIDANVEEAGTDEAQGFGRREAAYVVVRQDGHEPHGRRQRQQARPQHGPRPPAQRLQVGQAVRRGDTPPHVQVGFHWARTSDRLDRQACVCVCQCVFVLVRVLKYRNVISLILSEKATKASLHQLQFFFSDILILKFMPLTHFILTAKHLFFYFSINFQI